MKARYIHKVLKFKRPSGTSRGILHDKPTYYIRLERNGVIGIGECSTLRGLSKDHRPDYEQKLQEIVDILNSGIESEEVMSMLRDWPSILFGMEMALLDLDHGGNRIIFPSDFTDKEDGIPINGLIWMGEPDFMYSQIEDLLDRGFSCLKMKIGAINFEQELEILSSIRNRYTSPDLVLRVDANGAFSPDDALEKLKILSDLELHSIEQPIMAGQYEEMAKLCEVTPLDIALDEELIHSEPSVLEIIKPQYIILKPSLVGGFSRSNEWIDSADKLGIGWWATSALESNVGLNAISQWTYTHDLSGHQGLGTGSLYTNNIASPLEIRGEKIYYSKNKSWELDGLF